MQRRTTTKKLLESISNNLLYIEKAEIHHKSSKQVDILSEDSLKESLEFLSETIFVDMIDWRYERNISEKEGYIVESGAMNPYTENIVTVYMRVCDGVSSDDVEKALLFQEDFYGK